MTPNIVLLLVVAGLFATGVYLLLARSVVRALIGFMLLSNGANILFLVASGDAGRAPIVGKNDGARMSDPLPQAMVLTAIVIGLGMTAFMLALAHRSWQLSKTRRARRRRRGRPHPAARGRQRHVRERLRLARAPRGRAPGTLARRPPCARWPGDVRRRPRQPACHPGRARR